ncbi:hypothetical protein [Elizabethkingia miricola]|uniref:hypothetical protein n=1 Tax=Elizabethkingia miricola TaxID=172045 RepID=UPI00099A08FA|nr:hypothetical protein [Elizabethkingia miricola]OPC32651.1 hypothetical protein BAX99_10535 [Elizabethkingia miricola]
MTNYEHEIQSAINSKQFTYSDIFDFRETPYEILFHNFYKFCRENLNIQSQNINIKPNFFVFSTERNINASAIKTDDNIYGIKINLGLITYCISKIWNNTKLDKYIEHKFPEITSFFDNPTSGLSFQLAVQFTYYHELGHLLQFTKQSNRSFTLQERKASEIYDINIHKLEINSDSYASIAIASHIQQYTFDIFNNNVDHYKIETVTKIFLCSLLNYVASFSNDLRNIYLDKHSHPHPFLRIFNIVLSVLHYLNQSSLLKNNRIDLHANKMIKSIFDFYEELEVNKIFDTNFSQALNQFYDTRDHVIDYLGVLNEFDIDNKYNNALDLWNKQIT